MTPRPSITASTGMTSSSVWRTCGTHGKALKVLLYSLLKTLKANACCTIRPFIEIFFCAWVRVVDGEFYFAGCALQWYILQMYHCFISDWLFSFMRQFSWLWFLVAGDSSVSDSAIKLAFIFFSVTVKEWFTHYLSLTISFTQQRYEAIYQVACQAKCSQLFHSSLWQNQHDWICQHKVH